MKTKLAILTLLAASSMFARVVVGVGVGFGGGYYAPAPPPPVYAAPVAGYYVGAPGYAVAPAYAAPAAGYSWVGGYYYPVGASWRWRTGYWARPPYAGAAWFGPRYTGGRWYAGRWGRR